MLTVMNIMPDVCMFSFQDYPKLSQTYYGLLECLAQDHMTFISNLEPQVFLYILSTISEGLTALGKCGDQIDTLFGGIYKYWSLMFCIKMHFILNHIFLF